METFIQEYTEKLLLFKKNVFNHSTAKEFIEKQTKKEDIEKVRLELTKCLIPQNKQPKDIEERKKLINDFITNLQVKKKNNNKDNSSNTKNSQYYSGNNKNNNASNGFKFQKTFKPLDIDKDPTLESLDLEVHKKKYEVLPHHYKNELKQGISLCNCLRTKHPLVGNCMNCGKIQCLQEGTEECIVCGTEFEKKEVVLKQCNENPSLLKAYEHKEKLLKFQKDFYSKLQIIDDFSDWYEVMGNSWLDADQRQFAALKDEECKRIKEDNEWQYNINLLTGEVNIEYEVVDENKKREEIANMFLNQFNNSNNKASSSKNSNTTGGGSTQTCRFDANMIKQFLADNENKKKNTNLNSTNANNFNENNTTVFNSNTNVNDNSNNLNKALIKQAKTQLMSLETIFEKSHFSLDSDKGMCLSMHQPWASLLVYGFKRIEGRDWESDYRGKLWIHATSQKPDRALVDRIEQECEMLYGKEHPPFPKRYNTSSILGCVDMVDCIKSEDYSTRTPMGFREENSSKYLFICKNPRILDIPHKFPGQPKLYQLEKDVLDKLGIVIPINTIWWPKSGLDVKSIMPRNLNDLINIKKATNESNNINIINKKNKMKKDNNTVNLNEASIISNNILLKQNILNSVEIERLLCYIDNTFKKVNDSKFTFRNNSRKSPYLQYCYDVSIEKKEIDNYNEILSIFESILNNFNVLNELIEKENIEATKTIKEVRLEYIDINGHQNFKEIGNTECLIKLVLGNSLVFSLLENYGDSKIKNVLFENGDVIAIFGKDIHNGFIKNSDKNNIIDTIGNIYNSIEVFGITQVMYDMIKSTKQSQGSFVISFILEFSKTN